MITYGHRFQFYQAGRVVSYCDEDVMRRFRLATDRAWFFWHRHQRTLGWYRRHWVFWRSQLRWMTEDLK